MSVGHIKMNIHTTNDSGYLDASEKKRLDDLIIDWCIENKIRTITVDGHLTHPTKEVNA